MSHSFLILVTSLLFLVKGGSLVCENMVDKSLPCVEVPRCTDGMEKYAEITVDQLSNGQGSSITASSINLCFTDEDLHVVHAAGKQAFIGETSFSECNDPIFNSNVVEMFVSPNMEAVPHCYNELDISPFNVMYDAGIYSPNLNHTGVQGYEFPCVGSNITHSTAIDAADASWTASLQIPFSLLNCPYNCPMARYCGHTTPNSVYQANFFRISQLGPAAAGQPALCGDTVQCEYLAWNPTGVDPPAFHEPSKFGNLLLQL